MTGIPQSGTGNPASSERESGEKFRLAVFGHMEEPDELRQILIESARVHPDDALTAARAVPGILPLRLSKDVARSVADEVSRRGIRTIWLPEKEIPRLDHAETIHHVGCQQQGLEVFDLHGARTRVVPWSDVSLLSVGYVPLKDGRRYSAESHVVVHAAPNPHGATVETSHRDGLVLWIVCENPRTLYRLVHNQLNYEYLGVRETTSATQNFSLFVADLFRLAPRAYLTSATRAFLNHGLRRHFEFHSAAEMRDYTAFQLLVMRELPTAAANIRSVVGSAAP
jgi:hypothetical protein